MLEMCVGAGGGGGSEIQQHAAELWNRIPIFRCVHCLMGYLTLLSIQNEKCFISKTYGYIM